MEKWSEMVGEKSVSTLLVETFNDGDKGGIGSGVTGSFNDAKKLFLAVSLADSLCLVIIVVETVALLVGDNSGFTESVFVIEVALSNFIVSKISKILVGVKDSFSGTILEDETSFEDKVAVS